MQAYILMNTEPSKSREVAEASRKIEGVKMAHRVTGQFDVVAYTEFTKMDDLGKIIGEIQKIKGITRTQTAIAIPSIIKE